MKFSALFLFAVGLLLPAASTAQNYDFEKNGLYYRISGDEVKVVKPSPDYVYSGTVNFPTRVEYKGTVYDVNFSSAAFTNSRITEFTLGEGWGRDPYPDTSVDWLMSFRGSKEIEKLTLMSPGKHDPVPDEQGITFGGLSFEFQKKLANCTMAYDGQQYTLVVKNLNVFDAKGNRLVPAIWQTGAGFSYPDITGEKGNKVYSFKLGKENSIEFWEEHGGVLPLSIYDLAFLYFKVEDSWCRVRFSIGKFDTGVYHVSNGIRYSVFDNEFAVLPPADGVYSGEINVPSESKMGNRIMPVTRVAPSAFEESDIVSLTLPETLKTIGYDIAYGCRSLERVDLSACRNVDNGGRLFKNCPRLKEVVMPRASTSGWTSSFENCTSLERINLPLGACVDEAFTGCTKLLNFNILSNTDDDVRFIINPQIFENDGLTPIEVAPESEKVGYSIEGNRKVYRVKKEDLYVDKYGVRRYEGKVVFRAVNPYGYLSAETGALFSVSIPENDESGIVLPEESLGDAPVEYYNLQGIRVPEPYGGVYIRRKGAFSEKVLIR